jgi:hypothetical protein
LSAIRQALLAGLVPAAERARVRARLQSALNGGLAAGAALGGLALYLDRPAAYLSVFALDAAGFIAAAAILSRGPAVTHAGNAAAASRWVVFRDRPYAAAAALNLVMVLYMPLLSLVLPLWIAQRTAAPRATVAALLVLNTLAVALFQVRVARRVTSLPGAARAVRTAGIVMLAACGVFALTGATTRVVAVALLLFGAALQVTAEMLLAAGTWEISFGLAPPGRHGQYQGFFGTGVPLARMAGPLLLTALILRASPWGWFVLGGLFLLAGTAMPPVVRWAHRSAAAASAAPTPSPPQRGSGRPVQDDVAVPGEHHAIAIVQQQANPVGLRAPAGEPEHGAARFGHHPRRPARRPIP